MRKWVLNMIPTLESEKKITCDLCILSKQPEIKNKNIENLSKTHMQLYAELKKNKIHSKEHLDGAQCKEKRIISDKELTTETS